MLVHICKYQISRHLQTLFLPCRNCCLLLKNGWLLLVYSTTHIKLKNSVVIRLLEDPDPSWKTECIQRAFWSMVYGWLKCFLQSSKFTIDVAEKPEFSFVISSKCSFLPDSKHPPKYHRICFHLINKSEC